jgi:NAD(P)-dependent dehydrogenase (short-subunit alcohol dehydrogenase family)
LDADGSSTYAPIRDDDEMTDTFKGKTTIVTGGTSGIGYGICESLLNRGAYVYVIGSKHESEEENRAFFNSPEYKLVVSRMRKST